MKKMSIYLGAILLAAACNMKPTTNDKPADATATSEVGITDNPYTLKHPYMDWQMNDQKNAGVVLKMIKAWETKNLKECASYFGDSVELNLEMYHNKLPNDSIIPFLERGLANNASIKVDMDDWESVISANKKAEWVTLWYKQVLVDKKGVADSANIVDDARLANGKIIELDEYTQHFPAAKKK